MKHLSYAVNLALIVLAILTSMLLSAAAVSAKDPPIAPPDEEGPYNVGYTTFLAQMSGGRVTQIRVFYPTLEEADHQTQYTIQAPAGTYQRSAPFNKFRQRGDGTCSHDVEL